MTAPVLTIAIPTFDRNAILADNLARLLPQLTPDCRVLVLDNCSPVPVADSLALLLAAHPAAVVEVQRNPINVGGSANVARCLEVCETEWVWVLGDDDPVRPGAVAAVLGRLRANTDALVHNFASGFHRRPNGWTAVGVRQFVDRIDWLGEIIFISANVFRIGRLRPHLSKSYHFLSTCSPHLVLMLFALGEDGVCEFHPDEVVDGTPGEWNVVTVNLMLGTVLDLPLSAPTRRRLGALLPATFCDFGRLLSHLVCESAAGDRASALYYYDQLATRTYYFAGPAGRLRVRAGRLLVRYPRLGIWLFTRFYRRRYGRAAGDKLMADRLATPRLARI